MGKNYCIFTMGCGLVIGVIYGVVYNLPVVSSGLFWALSGYLVFGVAQLMEHIFRRLK
ncbi:hypothetical protein HY250_01575 [Candidatus Azambacteria bacterium]|nr:hypothetical protein [Candidatus Azambacteria bacterium]